MKKEMIGLNTVLYSFNLKEIDKFNLKKEKLKKHNKITIVYINNGVAFEAKKLISL